MPRLGGYDEAMDDAGLVCGKLRCCWCSTWRGGARQYGMDAPPHQQEGRVLTSAGGRAFFFAKFLPTSTLTLINFLCMCDHLVCHSHQSQGLPMAWHGTYHSSDVHLTAGNQLFLVESSNTVTMILFAEYPCKLVLLLLYPPTLVVVPYITITTWAHRPRRPPCASD